MHFVIVPISTKFASTGGVHDESSPGFQHSNHFIHIIFLKENFFEVGNKANPPRLSVIFSKSYLIRKHRIPYTIQCETKFEGWIISRKK